jgi:glycosyltransferase involved in cell wall biosynthesis
LLKIKALAKKKRLDVKFTGKLSKQEWIKLSEGYDVFINTTHFDNTPVSVIEAMALGLPIVSTNVGGITYLLENNKTALLVNDNDMQGMTMAIKKIIQNRDLKQHLVKNAQHLVQEFDWDKVKNKWDEVLK